MSDLLRQFKTFAEERDNMRENCFKPCFPLTKEMCIRLIKKLEKLERYEELEKSEKYDDPYEHGSHNANNWIPCSMRMPETEGIYLVCYKNKNCYPSTSLFLGGKFHNSFGMKDMNVLAWMHIPEPYKERESNEQC